MERVLRPAVLKLEDSMDVVGDSLTPGEVEEGEGNSGNTSSLGDWGHRGGRVHKVEEVGEVDDDPLDGETLIVHKLDDCLYTLSVEYVLAMEYAYLRE